MTIDELHRTIAKALEPEPQWEEFDFDSHEVEWRDSKLGFWQCLCVGNGVVAEPKPVNFSESENASARLLDAMAAKYYERSEGDGISDFFHWLSVYSDGILPDEFPHNRPDRKTAVILIAKHVFDIEGEFEL